MTGACGNPCPGGPPRRAKPPKSRQMPPHAPLARFRLPRPAVTVCSQPADIFRLQSTPSRVFVLSENEYHRTLQPPAKSCQCAGPGARAGLLFRGDGAERPRGCGLLGGGRCTGGLGRSRAWHGRGGGHVGCGDRCCQRRCGVCRGSGGRRDAGGAAGPRWRRPQPVPGCRTTATRAAFFSWHTSGVESLQKNGSNHGGCTANCGGGQDRAEVCGKKKFDYHRTSANLSNRCGTG